MGLLFAIMKAVRTMERETGLEPATSTLARLHSTTELLPLNEDVCYHTKILEINPGS